MRLNIPCAQFQTGKGEVRNYPAVGRERKEPEMADRYIKIVILFLGVILFLTGCAGNTQKDSIADKNYLYEKEGFGGDFIIQMKGDGTFSYYEGELSSYIGTGEWKLDGNTLMLQDTVIEGHPRINYFKVEGNTLIFQSEDSDNFIYIKVSEGERFSAD